LNIPGFILEASSQQTIPTMFITGAFWMERGVLASYGPDYHEIGRQAARLVDKILKGADPAEIPVEVNPKSVCYQPKGGSPGADDPPGCCIG
jgi:putative ABC transport system substrate-binding protein